MWKGFRLAAICKRFRLVGKLLRRQVESHSKRKHCLQSFTVTKVLRSDSSLGHEVFVHHRAVWDSPAANAERTFRVPDLDGGARLRVCLTVCRVEPAPSGGP